MSEIEELKKQALLSKAKQAADELGEYLKEQHILLEKQVNKLAVALICMLVICLALFVVPLFYEPYTIPGFFLLLAGVFYTNHLSEEAKLYQGRLQGAIRVLEILGMYTPSNRSGKQKKKNRVWEFGKSIVRGWVEKKNKAQKEAFAGG